MLIIIKVDTANFRQVSKLFFTVAKWKGPFFKGQGHIGSSDSLLCYLQVQLRQMTINDHANVGLPHVILFNKVAAFNSIK